MKVKFIKKLSRFILIVLLGCSTYSNQRKSYHNKQQTQQVDKLPDQKTITVWIHGTRTLTQGMRNLFKQVFSQYFALSGLHPANSYKEKNNIVTIAKTLNDVDHENYPFEDFFIFGWSGVLNKKDRKEEAEKLYQQLIDLLDKYEKRFGQRPQLRIITHSHGGNVALYLADIESILQKGLFINELILLACPVQKETSHLIASPIFNTIFSLYSKGDVVQVLDPQGLTDIQKRWIEKNKINDRPLFSERTFKEQDNLKQHEVILDGRSILHSEFMFKPFISKLPEVIASLKAQ